MCVQRGLVSIGMPVRNNKATLAIALLSIMQQTYEHWELFLIDDGSIDGSQAIQEKFAEADKRIKLITDGRAQGLPERLNQAIATRRIAFRPNGR